MGYYIETTVNRGKTGWLITNYDATVIKRAPSSLAEVPGDKALIVVVDNTAFEAAGYVYDDRELIAFTDPRDYRPKTWLLMDRETARHLSGFCR